MSVSSEKVRQLWLPFLILALIVLAASWILASVIYPNNIRGEEAGQVIPGERTPTLQTTGTPTSPATTAQVINVEPSPTTGTADLKNCTYTRYYWLEHPDSWMIENVIIASLSFTKDQALEILSTEVQSTGAETTEDGSSLQGDLVTPLLQELFAALLNTLKGAAAGAVEPVLIEASDWLNAHPADVEISQAEREQAQDLIQSLADYNNGFTGPGHCADEPVTPTPIASPTATPTETPTPTPIRTLKPAPTATDFDDDDNGGGGGSEPTDPPSATDPPPPTDEPPPPPPPTDPPPPPPTSAPTKPPPPPDTPGP
jgi:hypothetical protein